MGSQRPNAKKQTFIAPLALPQLCASGTIQDYQRSRITRGCPKLLCEARHSLASKRRPLLWTTLPLLWQSASMETADNRATFSIERGRIHAEKRVVTPGRLELPTRSLGNCCSIHLSYGATFK